MAAWWPFGKQQHEAKASAAGSVISSWNFGLPVWSERDFAKLADEAYVRNAVAFRCVKLIASAAATTPWLLSKGGKEIEEHPLLDLLQRPAPMIGGHSLFEAFFAYLLLSGNTYLEGVGPDGKPPRELWSLRPDRIRVIAGPQGLPSGYEYTANGRTLRWQVDPLTGAGPICHVKEFHPLNDWYGLSRIEPAAYGIDRHNAASAHNKALLDNGGRPSGALVFEPVTIDGQDQNAPQAVIDAARKELEANHIGPANAGRAFVYGGNVKWMEMSTSPKDMDFGQGKDDAARDICTALGVPHLLIVPGSSTYSNMADAKLDLWEQTVIPLLDKAVDALDAWLCPQFGDGLELGIDLDEISALEPRRESKRKTVVELLEKGVIDNDEARDALQYGPRSPDAVKKVDAQVLGALITGAKGDPALFEPLHRYMLSVGLVPPGSTVEGLLAAADAAMGDQEAELAAATTPPAQAPADASSEEET
ncbi:MAG: phage portal protein [Phenylobacterium sp.]|nr:phage portal protein [Phenylobacterium sp.]